jgi:hypothetical protein
MSVTWPRGLKLLVKAIKKQAIIDEQTFEIAQALAFASCHFFNGDRSEYTTAEKIDDEACEHAGCIEILQPLLELGIPCDYHALGPCSIFAWTCDYAQRMILKRLRAQRDILKYLATQHLSAESVSSLSITEDSTLDASAGRACSLLKSHGIYVPRILHVPLSWQSVYREMRWGHFQVDLLEMIWDNGFRDLSVDDIVYTDRCMDPSCMVWFLNHGINLDDTVATSRGPFFVAHLSAAAIAHFLLSKPQANWDKAELSELLLRFRHDGPADECHCPCSPIGCSPTKVLLHLVMQAQDYPPRDIRDFEKGLYSRMNPAPGAEIVRYLVRAQMGQRNVNTDFHGQMIRLCTFEKLELPHSCCTRPRVVRRSGPYYGLSSPLKEEESLEMMEEDRDLVRLLEDLTDEFVVQYSGSNCTLQEFIDVYWTQRMRDVLHELDMNAMTEEQRRAAEEAGVVWQSGLGTMLDYTKIYAEDGREEVHERLPGSYEYWAKKIEDI